MAGSPRRPRVGQAYCTHLLGGREAVEREPRLAGEVDREARGCADGDEAADAGRDGLLHELEAGAPADHQAGGRRFLARQHPRPDHLVDRVVPAHVLPDDLQHAVGGRQGGGVHAAGAVEEPLARAQTLGELPDDLGGGDLAGPPGPVHDVEHLGHAVLAADPAGRRPGAARLVAVGRADVGARCHRDGDDVELLLREQVGVGAVGHLTDRPERTQ